MNKNSMLMAVSLLLRPVFALGLQLACARSLIEKDFAQFVVLWNYSILIGAVADLGTRNTALIDLAGCSNTSAWFFFRWRWKCSVVVGLISFVLITLVSESNLILVLCVAAIGINHIYADPSILVCRAERNGSDELKISAIQYILAVALIVCVISINECSVGLVIFGLVVVNYGRSVFGMFTLSRWDFRGHSNFQPSIHLPGALGVLATSFALRVTVLAGDGLIDDVELGVLGTSLAISQLLLIFSGIFLNVILPNDLKGEGVRGKPFWLFVGVTVFFVAVITVLLPFILRLFGDAFSTLTSESRILIIAGGFGALNYFLINRLFAHKISILPILILITISVIRWFYVVCNPKLLHIVNFTLASEIFLFFIFLCLQLLIFRKYGEKKC